MIEQQELYVCEVCSSLFPINEIDSHACNSAQCQPDPLQKNIHSEDSIVEMLIGLVQIKRPLWDHRLPISQRGKNEKDKLWSEIWKEMGGVVTIDNLQKKWKNLRDQFMKTKVQIETYVPSGSATPSKKKVWKHYETLKFLRDTVQPKLTSSNPSFPNTPLSDDSSASVADMPSPAACGSKRRKKQDNFEESLVKHLQKPIEIPAPAAPQVLPSLVMASSLLAKLPMRVRRKAERDFLNTLYDLIEECESN